MRTIVSENYKDMIFETCLNTLKEILQIREDCNSEKYPALKIFCEGCVDFEEQKPIFIILLKSEYSSPKLNLSWIKY